MKGKVEDSINKSQREYFLRAKLKEIRPYVIVGAFVVGAVFTPPDVISQLMLAVPLWILYELGILVASIMMKSRPADDAQAPGANELGEVEAGNKKD